MSPTHLWLLLFLMGAYHGVNPGMGWLFAVALGLQEQNGHTVFRALLPLALGHLVAIGGVVAAMQLLSLSVPLPLLRGVCALVLIGFGIYRLVRVRHPRWVGMRVNALDLALWSFIMASAHGAGLMLLPFLLPSPQNSMPPMHHHMPTMAMGSPSTFHPLAGWVGVGFHTLGYLLVTAALAAIVYYKVGVAVLRRSWINLDLLWAWMLVLIGILTLFW